MIGQISAELRSDTGTSKAKRMRRAGRIPSLLYGSGNPAQAISISARDFAKILSKVTHVVNLSYDADGSAVTKQAQIKDVQYHPINQDEVLHVDFYEIPAGQKIDVVVQLRATGTPVGVNAGGQFAMEIRELHVSCLPTAIPEEITIDISELQLNDSIQIGDLKLPEGVEALQDETLVLCNVNPPRGGLKGAAGEEGSVEGSVTDVEVLSAKDDAAEG